MKYYFAPMEGITLYPLRNIHHEMFGGNIQKYYTPFLTAAYTFHFKKREKKDVLPEYIKGFDDYGNSIVPQIMAGSADTFIWAAKEMHKLGYNEVNFNLGCPAATVTNSHKGSGLLQDTEYLDKLLDGIFTELDGKIRISLKTRLGFSDEKEAEELMKIYAAYPASELVIHARVREDFYRGEPRYEAFAKACRKYRECGGKADICYNGNINAKEDVSKLEVSSDSGYSAIMSGRGLLSNPALVREICGGEKLIKTELKEYLNRLYDEYATYIPEDRNVIFKLLEHWAFLGIHFLNSDKYIKDIRKARSKAEYKAAVNNIFSSCEFI